MHTLTIATKFTFGDEVRFDSINGKGASKVFAITVNWDKSIEYLIEIDMGHYSDLVPGIVDTDITEKLNNGPFAVMHAINIASKYSFREVIRFDSINGKGVGMVSAITVDWDKCISYVVKIEDRRSPDLQPGIFEREVLEKIADEEISNS